MNMPHLITSCSYIFIVMGGKSLVDVELDGNIKESESSAFFLVCGTTSTM